MRNSMWTRNNAWTRNFLFFFSEGVVTYVLRDMPPSMFQACHRCPRLQLLSRIDISPIFPFYSQFSLCLLVTILCLKSESIVIHVLVLCGQLLCFFKDQDDFIDSKAASPPINLYQSSCEKALDYTKKKHVMRYKHHTYITYMTGTPVFQFEGRGLHPKRSNINFDFVIHRTCHILFTTIHVYKYQN